jgi:alpha-L-fucosidase 2
MMAKTGEPLKLWYDTPPEGEGDRYSPQVSRFLLRTKYLGMGDDWNEALPLGNGRLGAMVFGLVNEERILLNEDSVWYGGPRDRNNPDARAALDEIRRLIAVGNVAEAEKLAALTLSGTPESQRHYEPLGVLVLAFQGQDENYTDYHRELDLETATVRISYSMNSVRYSREVFISAVDQVAVMRLGATGEGRISFQASVDRGRYADGIRKRGPDTLILHGITGGDAGIAFRAGLFAINHGGSVNTVGDKLLVEEADEVVLLLGAATSFRSADPEAAVLEQLSEAAKKSYAELFQDHLQDYQRLFGRVSLDLEGQDYSAEPTKRRLAAVKEGRIDPGLERLLFQFGRYLLICSTRPGTLPTNMLGLWNKYWLPQWDSKYTININIEMNYWPAEVCALPECHEALFEQIERMRRPGRHTAKVMYGCRGFTAHHNTDIWADTAPQDIWLPATYWPMGAAWLCLHLWEHYAFGVDRGFLEKAYPTMREAAEFFLDFLIEDSHGRLVTSPSVSPENTYIMDDGQKASLCMGPAMDSQILDALFSHCIEASEILGEDDAFCRKLRSARKRLPQIEMGRHGQIKEWLEDYDEAEPGHRHISHLFALYPENQIDRYLSPKLAEAARVSVERRLNHGGGQTGWSRAWIVNCWARLGDGDRAHQSLQVLLNRFTLPNLFGLHPPFSIDGNFGATAGIAEMLLQSHRHELRLLPAVPSAWSSGEIEGLRARGGFVVDIAWRQGEAVRARILSTRGESCRLRSGTPPRVECQGTEVALELPEPDIYEFPTEAGQVYAVVVG